MKNLWLDIGNTRLKYWITQEDQILEQGAELHLQSPADLLLGLIQHFKNLNIQQIGVSSVQDKKNNDRIRRLLKSLNVPITFAQVQANYAGLQCVMNSLNNSELTVGCKCWPSHVILSRTIVLLAVARR